MVIEVLVSPEQWGVVGRGSPTPAAHQFMSSPNVLEIAYGLKFCFASNGVVRLEKYPWNDMEVCAHPLGLAGTSGPCKTAHPSAVKLKGE